MSSKILPLPIFNDNYVWTIIHQSTQDAVIVDPGDADAVIEHLNQNQLNLRAILITHHHPDHVGGVKTLTETYKVPVYGPATESIPCLTYPLEEKQRIELPQVGLDFDIIDVPGHTTGHIAYYSKGILLCGDTLFSAGCGRLFEGTAAQLFNSLSKLAKLPLDTKVYCTHEYTLSNLKFAQQVEPNNKAIQEYMRIVQEDLADNKPSLPSTIQRELEVNPFLRCNHTDVQASAETYAGKTLNSDVEVFAALRRWKDNF